MYPQKRQVMKMVSIIILITFRIAEGLSLISNSDDEAEKEEQWSVQIFDYDDISFADAERLLDFINIVKENTHAR